MRLNLLALLHLFYLLYVLALGGVYVCPHATHSTMYARVLIYLLCIRQHTSTYAYVSIRLLRYMRVSSYIYYAYVSIRLRMHTSAYVFYDIYVCPHTSHAVYVCPHTTLLALFTCFWRGIQVSAYDSFYYICVLIGGEGGSGREAAADRSLQHVC